MLFLFNIKHYNSKNLKIKLFLLKIYKIHLQMFDKNTYLTKKKLVLYY